MGSKVRSVVKGSGLGSTVAKSGPSPGAPALQGSGGSPEIDGSLAPRQEDVGLVEFRPRQECGALEGVALGAVVCGVRGSILKVSHGHAS